MQFNLEICILYEKMFSEKCLNKIVLFNKLYRFVTLRLTKKREYENQIYFILCSIFSND